MKEGINGFLVNSANSEELANKIIVAANKRGLRKIGLEGYRLVAKKYTWDLITKQTFEIYHKVLSGI